MRHVRQKNLAVTLRKFLVFFFGKSERMLIIELKVWGTISPSGGPKSEKEKNGILNEGLVMLYAVEMKQNLMVWPLNLLPVYHMVFRRISLIF